MASGGTTLTIAVGSAVPGSGQSMVCANLAIALAPKLGRVVLVDAGISRTPQSHLFSLDASALTLDSFLAGEVWHLEEAALQTRAKDVWLVAKEPGSKPLSPETCRRLVRHARDIDARAVLFDCDRGEGMFELLTLADARVLVTGPQMQQVQATYSLIRQAVSMAIGRCAVNPTQRTKLLAAREVAADDRIASALLALARVDRELAERLERSLRSYRIALVGNQLTDAEQVSQIHALGRMTRDFLAVDVTTVGGLRSTKIIGHGCGRGSPFMTLWSDGAEERVLVKLAEQLSKFDARMLREWREQEGNAGETERPQPPEEEGSEQRMSQELIRYRRRHERYMVSWPATVHGPDGNLRGQLVDVSLGGVAVIVELRVPVGSELELTFDCYPSRPRLTAVVRCEDRKTNRLGLQFVSEQARPMATVLVQKAKAEAAEARKRALEMERKSRPERPVVHAPAKRFVPLNKRKL